jgi:signal transduction histidine kinase
MRYLPASLRWWLLTLVLGIGVLGGAPPSAATPTGYPVLQSLAWWMDTEGQADLSTVQKIDDWQAFTGWKSFGYGKEPVWFRVRLQAAEPGARHPWIVNVGPAFLDDLTLYDPVAGLEYHSGDFVAPVDDALGSLTFTFQIPALSEARDVYLRLQSTSARTIHVDVLPFPEANRLLKRTEWMVGFLMALGAVFAFWASLQWWHSRERVMGIFALKQVVAVLWAFFMLGFARIAIGSGLPPGVLSGISSLTMAAIVVTVTWFVATLLREYQPRRFWLVFLYGLIAFQTAVPLLQLIDMTRLSLQITNALIALASIAVLITLVTARGAVRQPAIPLSWLVAYYLSYTSLNFILTMTHLGILPETLIVAFGNLPHVVFDGLVMATLLQIRSRNLAQRQLAADQALLQSQAQAHLERQHRVEQSQLFAMLAHEMKTPLATLRMWMEAGPLQREAMSRTINDMNQVIERCVHTGQLADQGLLANNQVVDAGTLTGAVVAACRAPQQVDVASAGVSMIETDEQMLSIVLSNLLDNACKYGASDGRITVSLMAALNESGQAGWQWEVSNRIGQAGLPDAEKVFDKYYRSPQARRQSGSGLGLFLVKGLLAVMHGTIAYAPNEDAVVFRVWLPTHPAV